jgi:CubicO group peptidase (beta-lactamase class C family)
MTTEEPFVALSEYTLAAMQHLHVPGVALGILHEGRESTAGFGVTNLENPLPVHADTLFQVGSITKTVTATAMMRLVERGLVALDEPLRSYLPGLRLSEETVASRVSLRHVFTHTCGWVGDYFDDAGLGDDALATVVSRMDRLAQETPLGEVYSYNNAGFYLAGRVIEVLTGKPYETAARELVLDPLEMHRSFFFSQEAITYRVAAGHDAVYPGDERLPRVLRPWWLARVSNPLGGLLSTVHDMLRYARFHLGDGQAASGERLLSKGMLAAMQKPAVPAANGEWMGISWFLREVSGRGMANGLANGIAVSNAARIVRHGGATNGQMAMLQLVPDRDFALVILTNSDRGSELYRPLAKEALTRFLGIVEPVPQPIESAEPELRQYTGVYTSAAQDLHLDWNEDKLILQVIPRGGFPTPESPPPPAPPPSRLALCAVDTVLALDEPLADTQGEFLRGRDGEIAWLRFSGRVHRRC